MFRRSVLSIRDGESVSAPSWMTASFAMRWRSECGGDVAVPLLEMFSFTIAC